MSQHTFACHMKGAERPATCAGYLLSSSAYHNLSVRMKAMRGELNLDKVSDGGHKLFDNYREMAVANGVKPRDPRIKPCR
jgi:hypothetical protein